MGFASDVDKWCKKVPLEVNNGFVAKVAPLFNNVVELSPNSPTRQGPFSTGVVKGNWYSAVDSMNISVDNNPDPSGGTSYSRIKATLASLPWLGKDATVTLTNSTPYIGFVESVGWPANYPNPSGWHWTGRSGPYAMVQTAITNFKGATP